MKITSTLDPKQSVADVVLDHSACAQVFKRHHIDFCCSGDVSIEAAAKKKGVDVAALISELSAVIAPRDSAYDDPRDLSTPSLVAHIVSKHHDYLREVMPFVGGLAAKVSRVHGAHNPKLRDLHAAFDELAATLMPHLLEEEQKLFPALTAPEPDTAAASKLLASMADEHLAVAKLLARIHAASDGFTLPDWACNSYRTLFAELRQIEGDIFTLVHLENHVLKPRFAA